MSFVQFLYTHLFFQHRFSINYKNIIGNDGFEFSLLISAVDTENEVRLNVFYKSKKLRNLIIKNSTKKVRW